jgi:hypothetical protein
MPGGCSLSRSVHCKAVQWCAEHGTALLDVCMRSLSLAAICTHNGGPLAEPLLFCLVDACFSGLTR